MQRRSFLSLLGFAPFAGKAAADAAAAELAGLQVGPRAGGPIGVPPSHGPPESMPAYAREPAPSQVAFALKDPTLRREIESVLYEAHRAVTYIDYDIAAVRSFSLAAKVTFQRQRNVERQMVQMQQRWGWQRINAAVWRALGIPVNLD